MINTVSVKHHTYVSAFCKKLLPVFLLSAAIALFLPGAGGPAMAQDAQVQDSGGTMHVQGDQGTSNPATPASQQQGKVSGQAQQQPHEAGDLQGGEITYFDPSTIPESVPIPDADWVFEVPIDVSDLPPEVTQLGIVCQAFFFTRRHHKNIYGEGKKRLHLEGGSYHGSILIGASVDFRDPGVYKVDEYECYMYLIGPDNRWVVPDSDPVSPVWRRADPSRPFKWKTGRQSIPEEARIGRE